MLILSNDSIEALKKAGVPPAQEIVVRLSCSLARFQKAY